MQVVEIQRESTVLGGAGNVVSNLISLGTHVVALGVVGNDSNGKELLDILMNQGASIQGMIIQDGRKTSKKSRVIASHRQVVRYDSESKENISLSSEEELLACFKYLLQSVDLVILSDYGKGVLTPRVTSNIIALAKKQHKPILVDPKGEDYSKYSGATYYHPIKKRQVLLQK